MPDSVIDFGAHYHAQETFPESFPRIDGLTPPEYDLDVYSERLAEGGIDGAVLSQSFYMGHDDVDATAAANDALLAEIDAFDRFYGLAAIPTGADGHEAAEEFERCLENGYNGGALPTKVDGKELNDEELRQVLDVANGHGAPILVHPKLNESLHPDVLDDRYKLNAIFGREAALSESICKVIHDGVLDERPDLHLVYHHHGGNIAAMMGRIHLRLEAGRWNTVSMDEEEWTALTSTEHVKEYDEFKSQLEDRIYIDTSGFLAHSLPTRAALEELGASQIVLGTDAPYEPTTPAELRRYITTVEEHATRRGAEAILHDNTMELLANTS